MPAPRLTAVAHAHAVVSERVRPGDRVVDATAGNGHDTRFLADLVGPTGEVLAIDIQPEAIARTRQQTSHLPHVKLLEGDHARLSDLLPHNWPGTVAAVMFNLGYLPSSDRRIQTRADSTVSALESAAAILKPSGIITVVAYQGHPGASEEVTAVGQLLGQFEAQGWQVDTYDPMPGEKLGPIVWVLRSIPTGEDNRIAELLRPTRQRSL